MRQVHLFITGFVQGVGYRNFVQHKAKKMNISGWVRNLSDKRVEVIAQADEKTLQKFIGLCKQGSFVSEVKDVSVEWQKPDKIFESFVKHPTA